MDERSPIYNLKVVVSETSVKPETLRAWERRYGFPKPQRTPGGHRLYTMRDIRTINWLIDRQKEGLSISRAVELWKSLENSGQDPLHAELLSQPFSNGDRSILDFYRQEWIDACLSFDKPGAENAIKQAFAIAPPEQVCIEVFQKGLVEIGQKWLLGEASVQQEHFATSLAMSRVHTLIDAAPAPSREGSLLAVCPAGEDHEFGLLLTTFILRRQGWQVIYLGANVPLYRLEAAIQEIKPILTIALAQTFPAASSLAKLGSFLEEHGTRLAFGGGIINAIPSLIDRIPGYFLGETIEGSTKVIEKIVRNPGKPIILKSVQPEYPQVLDYYRDKKPLIEAAMIDIMNRRDDSSSILAQARDNILENVEAALLLGDIELLEWPLRWLNMLMSSYNGTGSEFQFVLNAFIQAIDLHLDEHGAMINNYLYQAISNQDT